MGIYITLKRPEANTFRDFALNRIHYTTEIIRFFSEGHIFIPEEISIWRERPSEALGGHRLKPDIKISDFFRDMAKLKQEFSDSRYYPFEQLISTVIQIDGYWDIEGNQLAGFFSINNNPSWREVYRDIEIDAYGKGEIEDLVDAIWKSENAQGIVKAIIQALNIASKGQTITPHEVFFSIGVPSKGEVKNMRGILCPSRRYMLDFFYSTLSEQGEMDVRDKLGPLKQSFFTGTIAENKVAIQKFEEALDQALIKEDFGNSVTYFAKEPDSFARLYEKIYETVFKPAFKNLPRANDVRQRIANGLENISQLG
jgi:hypothetical protein